MKKALLLPVAFALILRACNNNQKEKVDYSADSTSTQQTAGGQATEDAVKSDVDEDAIIRSGFKSADGIPTVVDFSATWCGPCRQFKPIFHQTAADYKGKVDFISIDVDSYQRLSEKYGVQSIPCIIYFDANGKEMSRTVGFLGQEEFNVRIDQLLGK